MCVFLDPGLEQKPWKRDIFKDGDALSRGISLLILTALFVLYMLTCVKMPSCTPQTRGIYFLSIPPQYAAKNIIRHTLQSW